MKSCPVPITSGVHLGFALSGMSQKKLAEPGKSGASLLCSVPKKLYADAQHEIFSLALVWRRNREPSKSR